MITTINEFKKYIINENVIPFNESIIEHAKQYMDENFYKMEYMNENGIENEDDINENDYESWFEEHIEYILNDLISDLEYLFSSGFCTIYRKITVNSQWFNNLKSGDKLGIYWSYERDAAETHWGYNDKEKIHTVELIAKVSTKNVDFDSLYETFIRPYTGVEEKEITLLENTKFKLLNIFIDDIEQDLTKFKNKIFTA